MLSRGVAVGMLALVGWVFWEFRRSRQLLGSFVLKVFLHEKKVSFNPTLSAFWIAVE